MTEHPHQLYAVPFTAADQARLAGFSCGDEPWSRHVAEWILGSDVLESMQRFGTRVWLFETESGAIVGFGSLGTTVWRWPPPDGTRTTIALIPMLGLDARYQGAPPDPTWRYSRQIMAHLIAEAQGIARDWPTANDQRPDWLVLMVHRDNARAIRFYEQCGLEQIPGVLRRNDHLVMKLWLGA
ncbi:MAG TPA: N-acetyltransferase [Pirellulaceae bacterium]|nr:N-acetyltransferase [Pirellulaceae bacterium]